MNKQEVEINVKIPEGFAIKRIDCNIYKGEYYHGELGEPKLHNSRDIKWSIPLIILEKVKWRAELGQDYCYISEIGRVITIQDLRTVINEKHWEAGNYFEPNTGQAEEVALKIQALFGGNGA